MNNFIQALLHNNIEVGIIWRVQSVNRKIIELITFLSLFCFTLSSIFFDLRFLTNEDGIVEYLSVAFWMIGIIFSVRILLKSKSKKKIVPFVILIVCFIFLGEEISWGQRIFGFETPQLIAAANRQSEFNFHNLYAFSGGSTWRNFFKTGEFDIYQIIDAQNLFRIGFIVLFILFPILYNAKRGEYYLSMVGYYKPEIYFSILVGVYFAFSFLIRIGINNSNLHSIQEIREMAYALLLGMYLVKYFFYTKQLKE